jgi:DNA polymerase-4
MNTWEARQACPSLIFVVGNNARYTHTCAEMTKIFERFTPDVEVYSVDEAFLDITASHHLFGGPMEVGRRIKAAVKAAFGINCTVGIAPNILVAKLASDLGKPDGLNWIRAHELPGAIEHLDVDEIWGIGRKTAGKLAALGITTCGQLGQASAGMLRSKFGIQGERLKQMGVGQCDRAVAPHTEAREVRSVGHSMTLPEDVWDRWKIEAYLLKLSEKVGRRARSHGLMGRCVTLVFRYSDFETVGRQESLPYHTNDTHVIYRTALRILDTFRLKSRIRLLGVSLTSVVEDPGQLPLMEDERKRRRILEAMDEVNDKYGDFKLTWAAYRSRPAEDSREGGEVISPAWRPSGVRNVGLR